MTDPVYNLSLALLPTGDLAAAKSAPAAGAQYLYPLPLGLTYSDVFRKSHAPSPRELVQQLVGTAYTCASLNADLVASATLRLYVATRPGDATPKSYLRAQPLNRKTFTRLKDHPATAGFLAGDTTIQEVTHHPLLNLLRAPQSDADNPGLSGYDLRWMTQLYLESVGRAYWLVERNGLGVPQTIWLLRSHLVREIADVSGKRLIDHYEYGRNRYDPSEIIRFHVPDPENPYFGGYSPLMAAIEKIRIARKEDAHVNALLENMGRPDAIWSPRGDSEGGGIGTAEAQRVRSAFRQQYSMAGRGGLLVSEYPGTLQPLQWPPQDVVEIERAKAIKTDVCNCFAVPDAKLERNAANLASAKTADYAHKVDAGVPRLRRLEETLNARLIPLFDDSGRLFVAYDSPVPEDEIFALEQTKAASVTGAITRNEIRESVGLDPVPWGEQPLVPDNMVEVDAGTGKPQRAKTTKPKVSTEAPQAKALETLAAAQVKLAEAIESLNRQLVSSAVDEVPSQRQQATGTATSAEQDQSQSPAVEQSREDVGRSAGAAD